MASDLTQDIQGRVQLATRRRSQARALFAVGQVAEADAMFDRAEQMFISAAERFAHGLEL